MFLKSLDEFFKSKPRPLAVNDLGGFVRTISENPPGQGKDAAEFFYRSTVTGKTRENFAWFGRPPPFKQKITQQTDAAPKPDSSFQTDQKDPRASGSIMFSYELGHGGIKEAYIPRIFSRTLPFKMDDRCFLEIDIAETGLPDPVTQVYVLCIHEKTFIETTGFVHYLFSYHHKST